MGRSADIPRQHGSTDGDDSGSPILHVDMDAFFASVEVHRRPELAGRPVIVGGRERGVVAAASYQAREFGVHSAMSMVEALRRCPSAVVLPPDRAAYSAASRAVMTILRQVTDAVQPLSLDEAFLDVGSATRLLGPPAGIARAIRRRIRDDLGLTCSVGVAPTKFVAKVASARCKPDGLLVVPAGDVLSFLHPLPVTVLWGVGARTAESLRRLGVRTVADLAAVPRPALDRAVGPAAAAALARLAAGIDDRPVGPSVLEKSISADRTVATDLLSEADVARQLLALSGEVGRRLRERQLCCRTVGIKIRYADFRTITRTATLRTPTDGDAPIYATARQLYQRLQLDRPRVRLVGVKAEGLVPPHQVMEQLSIDTVGISVGQRALDAARDAAVARFGDGAVAPASLLPRS